MILSLGAYGGLRGCPDFAPFTTRTGGCSNVPEELSSLAPSQMTEANLATRGWSYNQETGVMTPATNANYINPATGTDYWAGLETTEAAAAGEASMAEAAGRRLGLDISCRTYQNYNPAGPSLFGNDCTINGQSGHDAGLLLRPGGFEIAVAEASRAAGSPVSHVFLSPNSAPQIVYMPPATGRIATPAGVQFVERASTYTGGSGGGSQQTSTPPASRPSTPAAGSGTQNSPARTSSDITSSLPAPIRDVVNQASQATGLDAVPLLALAGVALFVLIGGRR